jgi:predicted acetyltransferase
MSDFQVRALQAHEVESAADLVARCLAMGDEQRYESLFQHYNHILPSRPHATPQHYRGAFKGNELVSCLVIQDFPLRYGRAFLHVAGIGAVCTHENFRRRGYASAVIKDSLTYAAEQGAAIALLNATIPRFYERFGFSPVWPHYSLQSASALAAQVSQPLSLRLAEPQDLPRMADLYEKHWGGRVCFERSPALWRWRMAYGRDESIVALDSSGMVQGYLWQPKDNSIRLEVVADSPEAVMSFLAYSGKRSLEAGYDSFIWPVPPDDVIIPYAQQLLPITLSASYFPTEGWMARLIDSAKIIDELLPEIISQAKSQNRDFDETQLLLRVQPDGVDIAFRKEKNSQCRLSLRDFIQILFGSLRPETLAIRQPLSRDSVRMLQSLFPPRVAALAAWDWF